jgi:signal peptidase II
LPPSWLVAAAVSVAAADQGIKALVIRSLPVGGSRPLVPAVLSLTHVQNSGVAFGWLARLPSLVTAAIALTLILALLYNRGRWLPTRAAGVGMALVTGGAAGNVLDRVGRGFVVDYLDLHFWPVFNLADIAIVLGAGILVIALAGGGQRSRVRR